MYLPLAAAGSHQMSTGSIENQGSDDIQSILPSVTLTRHPQQQQQQQLDLTVIPLPQLRTASIL